MCGMGNDRWPQDLLEWTSPESRNKKTPRKTWMEGIRNAIAQRTLNDGDSKL